MLKSLQPSTPAHRLPWLTVLGFGQLAIPLATAGLPIALLVSKFYTSDLGISIKMVGFILLIARIADFVVDPIIGIASDHTRWSLGRRRSWVLLGAPVFMLGVFMLFLPPPTATEYYLLVWIAVFYLGWTMITIPYGAWGAELSTNYAERSRITGVREIFTLAGLAFASAVPLIAAQFVGKDLARGGYWFAMEVLGWTIMVLTPIGVGIMFWSTPEPPIIERHNVSLLKGAKAALTNIPFIRLFFASACVRMGGRAVEVLLLYYLMSAIGLDKHRADIFAPVLVGSAIVFAPAWILLGNKYTKHRALAVAMAMGIGVFATLPTVQAFGFWPNIVMFGILGAAFSASYTLGQSIAADVVDLDSLRTREPRAGLMFSFFGLAIKGSDALGAGLALMLVGWLGFDANTTANAPGAVRALSAVFVILPMVFYLPGIMLLWNFPITPEVQARIRRLIERRIAIEERVRMRARAAHTTSPAPQNQT